MKKIIGQSLFAGLRKLMQFFLSSHPVALIIKIWLFWIFYPLMLIIELLGEVTGKRSDYSEVPF